MKKITIACLFLIFLIVTNFLNACSKETGQTKLQIKLTDNPYNAQEVNVDLKEVKVNLRDDSSGWQTIKTVPGVYNLLNLQNGIDTLIAAGDVPAGKLKEIRFVLGSNNSIVIDNLKYPLTIPGGGESGLKIKLNKKLHTGLDSVVIDFDAALSILKINDGRYHLRPVLKIK